MADDNDNESLSDLSGSDSSQLIDDNADINHYNDYDPPEITFMRMIRYEDNAPKVLELFISKKDTFDVNFKFNNYEEHFTVPLIEVLVTGTPELLDALLAHPKINVRTTDYCEAAPIHTAIRCNTNFIPRLLEDHRIDVNLEEGGEDPILSTTKNIWFDKEAIELVLCGMRRLRNIKDTISRIDKECTEKVKAAWTQGLLEEYLDTPFSVIKRLREKHGLSHYGPVTLFVPVTLFCDGFFEIKKKVPRKLPSDAPFRSALRFFSMMEKLPMELQMIICNRVYGIAEGTITAKMFNIFLKIFVADGWMEG